MELFDFSQYTFGIAAIQCIVAVIIFFVTNWLGGHTPVDRGYVTLSLIAADDTMPAFNFVFKTLTPLAFLLANSYMIIVYYWLIRGLYYTLRGAFYLANWPVFMIYMAVSVGIAMLIYGFVDSIDSILPSKEAFRDQLWILIVIFIYQVINQLQIDREGTEKRKHKYILKQAKLFKSKYGSIISSGCESLVDEGLVISIMIVENYNRPWLVRCVEYVVFFFRRKRMSLGIMQVKTSKFITEKQSVELGVERIVALRKHYIQELYAALSNYEKSLSNLINFVANEYNGYGDAYANEVEEIFYALYKDVFPNLWNIDPKEALQHKRKDI